MLCRSFGHFASACPNQASSSSSGSLPFRAPSHIVTHSQKGQNFLLLEHVNFVTENSAQTTDVALHVGVDCVKDPIPPAGVPSVHQTVKHCPLPTTVVSCVNVNLFESYLYDHPIQVLVRYICLGFLYGFDIGFTGVFSLTRPRNLWSALDNPEPVTKAISKELSRGHTSDPFQVPPIVPFHCSPLGAVPKKDGTFCIILDLSSPSGFAVNKGISKDDFSVKYSSFDNAVALVLTMGKEAFMAMLDICHAFRLCLVCPDQWGLLGYCWQGQFFVDTRLPFGSRSSPFIFNTFADLLLWILIYIGGIRCVIHYLDSFFICASSAARCNHDMSTM